MAEVYILLGPEEGEKNNMIRNIKTRVLQSWPDSECYTFFVGDDDEAQYASAVSQPSLFAPHRFIVLRGFESVKKTDLTYTATINAVKDNQSDLTLVIVSSESSSYSYDKALLDAAGKENIKTFWEMTEEEKKNWIYRFVRSENFTITPDAVDEILSSVENNTAEMKSVVLSVINFLKIKGEKNTIDRDDIEAYSTASKGDNGYTLFRALAEKNLDKALRIVGSIILNDSRNILTAVSVVANQFRRVEEAIRMTQNRVPFNVITKDLSAFSTYQSAAVPSQSFKPKKGINFKETELFRTAMKNYTLEDTESVILALGKADTPLKTAQGDNLLLTAEMLVYSIIENNGRENPLDLSSSLFDDPLS